MSHFLSKARLLEIEERELSASPGPWAWGEFHGNDSLSNGYEEIVKGYWCNNDSADCGCPEDGDAEFIAHSRADVPDLLTDNKRLRAALDQAIRLGGVKRDEGYAWGRGSIQMVEDNADLAAYLKETNGS